MKLSMIIVFVVILALLSVVSIILLKVSSKKYPEIEKEKERPKFEARKMTDLSKGTMGIDPIEKPKRKTKKSYKKKKSVVANNTLTEKKSVGRPKKSN